MAVELRKLVAMYTAKPLPLINLDAELGAAHADSAAAADAAAVEAQLVRRACKPHVIARANPMSM